MRKELALFVIGLLLISSCSSQKRDKVSSLNETKFNTLLTNYYEDYLKLDPFSATVLGDNRYNNLLPNYNTVSFRHRTKNFFLNYNNALTEINRDLLSDKNKLNYDLLFYNCKMSLESFRFKDYLMPINQLASMPSIIGQLAIGKSIQPFLTVKDYENWLSRLESFVVWCDSAIKDMRLGIKTGYTQPRSLMVKVIPQLEAFDHGPVKDHLFYTPIQNFPAGFEDGDKIRLKKAYEDIISLKIIPAFLNLKNFIKEEYIPACRTSAGICALPDGKDYYDYLINFFTTTNMSPDEIFKLGKSEIERIEKEMQLIKEKVGFKGSLKEFNEFLKHKKELMPYTKPEQVIENFNSIYKRIQPNLTRLFNKTPKTKFEIRRTEKFREASASLEYTIGSADGSRPGIFYVPIPDVKSYNVLNDEVSFLHEAIPGHHYQLSLQIEDTTISKVRNLFFFGAFIEGWALYTESLGKELGLYTDIYQYYGMLNMEIHRALRLVIDIGIHSKGWTREEAILYSIEHEAYSEEYITAEVERYMAVPGQALSYKVGQLKIKELRNLAEKELGDKFNIALFHDQILSLGSVPLQILEDRIKNWIESVKRDE